MMDCFKSILHLLLHLLDVPCHPVPSHLGPRPAALELSELSKLPPELILHIARFLPPESTLSFSLCCRPIYITFGPQVFRNLAQNSQHFEFLTLLARDLPNHVPCYYCKKLHAIEKAQQHIFSAYRDDITWLPCWKANHNFTFYHLHKNFSFTVFQMAMKRYRQEDSLSGWLRQAPHSSGTNRSWFHDCSGTKNSHGVAGQHKVNSGDPKSYHLSSYLSYVESGVAGAGLHR